MIRRLTVIALAFVLLSVASAAAQSTQLTNVLGDAPFIENLGQWAEELRFASSGSRLSVLVLEDELLLLAHAPGADGRRSRAVRLDIPGSSIGRPVGRAPLPAPRHVLRGADPGRWRAGVRAFDEVRLRDGVVLARSGQGIRLEWPRCLGPSATLAWQGGAVSVASGRGEVNLEDGRLSWDRVESHDSTMTLQLDWASYLGGTKGDGPTAVDMDDAGRVVLVGYTFSTDFPVTPGALDELFSDGVSTKADAFVAVLSANGTELEFATYLGGSQSEDPVAVAFAEDGSIFIAGDTSSVDYPTTDGTTNQGGDGFITRLDPTGSSLVTSTLFGSTASESLDDMVLHEDGIVTITGFTMSPGFPVTAPGFNVDPPGSNTQDVYVTRFDTVRSEVLWSVLYGGSEADQPTGLAVDEHGDVLITGLASDDIPLTDTALAGPSKGYFIAKIEDEGSVLAYSSFEAWATSPTTACAFDPLGRLFITGHDSHGEVPVTPDAFQPTMLGSSDAFLVAIDPVTGLVDYGTYIGGHSTERGTTLSIDASGVVTLDGTTESPDFPKTAGSFSPNRTTSVDIFVVRFEPALQQVLSSNVFGGSCHEVQGNHMVVGPNGRVMVVGGTQCEDFPVTPGSVGQSASGSTDAFIVSLSMLPEGVTSLGASTPGCKGPLVAGVTIMPAQGEQAFALTCSGAPSSTTGGLLALGRPGLASPVQAAGVDLWLPATSLVVVPGVTSDALGWVTVDAPIPDAPQLIGLTLGAQFIFPDACAPAGMSASNALVVTVQP